MIMRTNEISQHIASLDPEKDYEEISQYIVSYLAPFDLERALELALFRTYASPSISGLLEKTKEFSNRPQKRYDDTELLLGCVLDHGLETNPGKRALRRMNEMHGRYDISNDDYLYVLSTFVLVPHQWMKDYGFRPLTENEKRAGFNFYRHMGTRMRIKDIPEDVESLRKFSEDYEKKHFKYAPSNRVISELTIDTVLSFYLPKFLYPLGRPFVMAMLDDEMLNAFGYKKPLFVFNIIKPILRLRSRFAAWWPFDVKPVFVSKRKTKTYPEGYGIEELGTFGCPFSKQNEKE
jgi:hypothetical protein